MLDKCIFSNKIETSSNTNYKNDERTPLSGFLNFIKENTHDKAIKEKENRSTLPPDWNIYKKELSLRK
jgi:hypothetical protein